MISQAPRDTERCRSGGEQRESSAYAGGGPVGVGKTGRGSRRGRGRRDKARIADTDSAAPQSAKSQEWRPLQDFTMGVHKHTQRRTVRQPPSQPATKTDSQSSSWTQHGAVQETLTRSLRFFRARSLSLAHKMNERADRESTAWHTMK